jgi:membrane protein DedA with SNARE-associated domain
MGRSTDSESHTGRHKRIRKIVIPLLTLLIVILISVVLFHFGQSPQIVALLRSYGYLGAFLVSLIGNGTVLLPGIVLPILTGLGIILYPAVGVLGPIVVGVGAALGEIVGYMAGYGGRGVIEHSHLYERLVAWLRRWGTLAVFIFTLVPLFFDLVGLAAGALRFPLWKFVLVSWAGRTILYVTFILLAVYGWEAVLPLFG